ncbi:Uncharacterised protein [Yersinia nurmii]|uniref:Uncharacterized protein n=1 Tax=Yersinia nurmii TaxID=685706 RepID=A0ABM9S3D0_9GAMM|nr:Uncharacterised protein [Yersinia nurmii]
MRPYMPHKAAAGYSTINMKVPIQTTNMKEIPIKKYFTEQLPLELPRQQ